MTPNFVLRTLYTRAAAPAADAVHIDGRIAQAAAWLDAPWPDVDWADYWEVVVDELVDAATAGGFWPAWGRGLPAWDATPDDDVTGETALEDPLGIFPGTWAYVTPHLAGTITLGDGTRWNVSGSQTHHILVEAPYAAADEPSAAIRELGLYVGATPDPAHTADPYLPVPNIDDIGELRALDRITLAPRSALTSGKVRILVSVEA